MAGDDQLTKKEEKLELVNYRDGDPNPGSARDPIINGDQAYEPEKLYASNAPLNQHAAKGSLGNDKYLSKFSTAREAED